MGRAADASDRTYTIEEYERLPEDDRYREELVRGRLVREPTPAEEHGLLEVRLGHYLLEFVEARQLGVIVANAGYILEESPAPTVRGPDLSFIRRDRLEGGYPVRRFRRIAPDLAVEIVSPSNRARDLREKVQDYLQAGARMVWIVDPIRRTATIYRSAGEPEVLGAGDALDGADVLPGFRLPLSRLFTV